MRPSSYSCVVALAVLAPLAALRGQSPTGAGDASLVSTQLSASPDTSARRRFRIPAQPLEAALAEFSRQAELTVTLEASTAIDGRSTPIEGSFAPGEAIRRLLVGTRLQAHFADATTVVVSVAGVGTPARSLRRIVVATVAPREAGYVAARTSTATKTDIPLRDAPQAVTVVTRGLIADQAMQGMADLVRYVPGITMAQGEGHRDAPTIRGNSSTADFFVDGVRDDAQYFRDLYNAERVEALKGSNAMIFGRGGGGGVINRVSKEAGWVPVRSVTLEGGSFDHRRGTIDVGQGIGRRVAARFNGMYDDSEGFRDAVSVERFGVNPTVTVVPTGRTVVQMGYEFFRDRRTVDRGIPSFQGRPSDAAISTFFGDPQESFAEARVHAGGLLVEHTTAAGARLRNRTRVVHYDKFYQNVFASSSVSSAGTHVDLAAYNNATERTNLFNQTDIMYDLTTGGVRHALLLGAELGRQVTDNFRRTGYFESDATTMAVPFDQPTVDLPVTFRQSATDADNHVRAGIGAIYAQDRIELSRHWQALLGVRYDRFDLSLHNDRNDEDLGRADDLLAPRVGVLFKPVEPVSFYGSYGLSHLPSAGDQFSSLTATSRTLEPERFVNYELGAKWDIRPDLSVTTAAYRLDRSNSTAKDPADPARTVQTGGQRTTGFELGVSGNVTRAWQVAGGWSSQRATITRATTAAKTGATVPLVPHRTVSLWNRVRLVPALSVGLGLMHQADVYAAIDNSVTLPSFTRADAAVFVTLAPQVQAQINLENVFDVRYYATSHGNNNILPGASRTARVSLRTQF